MFTFSDDQCQTWSESQPVNGSERNFTTNDRLITLDTERILMPVVTAPKMTSVRIWLSDDDGVSWRKSRGDLQAPNGSRYSYPIAIDLADGNVVLLLQNSTPCLHLAHSRDGGETWTVLSQ